VLPVPGEVPEDWAAAQGTTATTGRDTGLVVDVLAAEITVPAGGRTEIGVTLANRARDEIRGELQLVSPWGTWAAIADPVRGFRVAPGTTATVTFDVAPLADTDPGQYWAMVKVMWFGRCQYAPTVRLVVAP
jgi:hypothetical protein